MRDPELHAKYLQRARELFKTRTAQEWEDLVAKAGSECAVCRTSAEWFEHPHARESQMVIEVDDPQYGTMLQPGINVRLSRTPRRGAPAGAQNRISIGLRFLQELETRPPPHAPPTQMLVDAMRAALDGVRVLDLCIILAGPTCGRTLAEFGADVIKIDNPMRGGYRRSPTTMSTGASAVSCSTSSPPRAATSSGGWWTRADVVAQNYRAGKLEKLGLSYEEVRQRKPDIIYASLNAFGHLGPWAQPAGSRAVRPGGHRHAMPLRR